MSAPLNSIDVLHFQRMAKCAGFYAGKLDGVWGSKTQAASEQWDDEYHAILGSVYHPYRQLDPHQEGLIHTLLPQAQYLVRRHILSLRIALQSGQTGTDAKIISGTRSYAEQNKLYLQKPAVTHARGGESWHNFGLAWDIGIFRGGAYLPSGKEYSLAGQVLLDGHLIWGGNWKTLKDLAHFQVDIGIYDINEVRHRFEAGTLDIHGWGAVQERD